MKARLIMAQTGYMTLASAVDDLARLGFREHFPTKAGKLLALDSGKTFNAPELVIRAYHRFEGVSDPDDMAIVYAIESHSGVRGTLVDAFGVYADPAVGVFLEGVPIRKAAQVGALQAACPTEVWINPPTPQATEEALFDGHRLSSFLDGDSRQG
jgi:hypothetical protein